MPPCAGGWKRCARRSPGTSEQVLRGARYGQGAMDARSETKVISRIPARSATPQTRVLVVTRRDGAPRAHFVVGIRRSIRDIASGFLLELHPGSPPSRPRRTCSEVP